MAQGIWCSINGKCLAMRNSSSSLTPIDQKTGRFGLTTHRIHFSSWPGAQSDHSRMKQGTSFQGWQ